MPIYGLENISSSEPDDYILPAGVHNTVNSYGIFKEIYAMVYRRAYGSLVLDLCVYLGEHLSMLRVYVNLNFVHTFRTLYRYLYT